MRKEHKGQVRFNFDPNILEEKQNLYNKIGFNDLQDNTDYVAYFAAENDLPINPDLTKTEDILKVKKILIKTYLQVEFNTKRDIIQVPDYYTFKIMGNYLFYPILLALMSFGLLI